MRRVLAFFGLALWKDLVAIHELAEVNMAYQLVLMELLDVQRQQIALMSATSDTPKQ